VRAVHQADQGAIRLGEDITEAEGRYTIRYELLPEVGSIYLRILVIGENGKPLQSSDVIRGATALEIINLTLPITGIPATERRIDGRVILDHGLPAEQLRLRLYRREFGGKTTLLSETTTMPGGQYTFDYSIESDGKAMMSLEVRAINGANEEISLSKPFNSHADGANAVLNLVAPGTLQPLSAEYRRLSADLTPHVGQMTMLADAQENDERQDVTVLNRATGWDARLIALASIAQRLSADIDVKLPEEAVYGLLRAGLPSDKLMLAQVGANVAEEALKRVRDAGIVDLNDQQISEFKQQFETFSDKVHLAVPAPGSRSTYSELLKASGLPDDVQAKFAKVYLNHQGDPAQLWESARKAGLDDTQIGRLQVEGKLAFLANNSQEMTARLMKIQINDPAQLVEQNFYKEDQWKAEIKALAGNDEERLSALIPAAYAGDKVEDRLNAYAKDMARKVRLSYPTQVLGRMVEQDAADPFKLGAARAGTAKLLKKAAGQGFRLGRTPVEMFFKSHVGAATDMADDEFKVALEHMKKLQRIYQITPTNEAMPVLLSLGMTSAYDIMAFSEDEFVERYVDKYGELYAS